MKGKTHKAARSQDFHVLRFPISFSHNEKELGRKDTTFFSNTTFFFKKAKKIIPTSKNHQKNFSPQFLHFSTQFCQFGKFFKIVRSRTTYFCSINFKNK